MTDEQPRRRRAKRNRVLRSHDGEVIDLNAAELADQYALACLDVGRSVARLLHDEPVRRGWIDAHSLRGYLDEAGGMVSRARWQMEYEPFIHLATRDLSANVVGILDSKGDTKLGRKLLADNEAMERHVALPELEPLPAAILRFVRDGSFDGVEPAFVPRQLVTEEAIVIAMTDHDNDADAVEGRVRLTLDELNESGYVDADLWVDSGRVRIALAGIVWLRDHGRVTMEQAKRNERTQVTINNDGTIYAISTGSGDIRQVIAPPVEAGDWSSLEVALKAVQVSDARIADLHERLVDGTGDRSPGWLERWATGSLEEATGNVGGVLMLAAGSEGVQFLMGLVHRFMS